MDKNRIVKNLGFESLNNLQETVLKESKSNSNLVVYSATGSGKTVAFLLPLIEKLQEGKPHIQALILTPARELALQIERVFKSIRTNQKVLCCYGGHSIQVEQNSLRHTPALVIGTPGRIKDHIERGNIDLDATHTLVLDEFDKSLELGFEREMKNILETAPNLKLRLLTSATKMEEIPDYTEMDQHKEINFLTETAPQTITKYELRAEGNDKLASLVELVKVVGEENTIVFCNHREAVDRISELLQKDGIAHERFHGGREQNEREKALIKFRNQSLRILVTTDLAARGLDIPAIKTVIHYQIPDTKENYTHRTGRTGRMGAEGQSILLMREEDYYPDYIEETFETFPKTETPTLPSEPPYTTIYIGAGKKDKVNKIDVVGLLCQKGGLDKKEIGQIDVLDRAIYVAVKRNKCNALLRELRNEKIKRKKVKIAKAN